MNLAAALHCDMGSQGIDLSSFSLIHYVHFLGNSINNTDWDNKCIYYTDLQVLAMTMC